MYFPNVNASHLLPSPPPLHYEVTIFQSSWAHSLLAQLHVALTVCKPVPTTSSLLT